jgi:AraC-like DNA-binding protein
MAMTAHLLAEGPGWHVTDLVCTAGPRDPAFEERHGDACIAIVSEGTFQWRSPHGRALLVPGAILLGNAGDDFECDHRHGTGDRCLAFHFAPARLEMVAAALPGARRLDFKVPRLPPLRQLIPLLVAAEAARDEADGPALAELALALAGAVMAIVSDGGIAPPRHRPGDERRVTRAVRRIAADAHEVLSLDDMADEAALSPYHFLRVFAGIVGMTPYQYLLRLRLHRAAHRLRTSDAPVATIAYEAGFADLSTFNRRFRRLLGSNPTAYRARR